MIRISCFDSKILSVREANRQKKVLQKDGWLFDYYDLTTNEIHYKRPNDKFKNTCKKFKTKLKPIEPIKKEVEVKVRVKEHKKIEWWKDNFKDL